LYRPIDLDSPQKFRWPSNPEYDNPICSILSDDDEPIFDFLLEEGETVGDDNGYLNEKIFNPD
jgi:hypothetical protein